MIENSVEKESLFKKISSQKFLVLSVLIVVIIYGTADYFTENQFVIIDAVLYLIIPGLLVSLGIFAILQIKQKQFNKSFTWLLTSFTFTVIAEQTWIIFHSVLDFDTFPSIADFFYVGSYGLMALFLFSTILSLRELLTKNILVFSIIISIVFLIPSLAVTFDLYSNDSAFEIIVGLSYPILDSIMLGLVSMVLLVSNKKINYFWICLTIGIILFVIADTIYLAAELSEMYHVGHPVNSIWLIAYLIIMAGVFHITKYSVRYTKQYSKLTAKINKKSHKIYLSQQRSFVILFSVISFMIMMLLYGFHVSTYSSFNSKETYVLEILIYGSVGIAAFFSTVIFAIKHKLRHASRLELDKDTTRPKTKKTLKEKMIDPGQDQRILYLENISQKTFRGILIISVMLGLILLYLVMIVLFPLINDPIADGPFLIENLRGDIVETWVAWMIFEGESISINIINSAELSQQKIEVIKSAILSEDTLKIPNVEIGKLPPDTSSVFYKGWKGALQKAAETETEFVIPTRFTVMESDLSIADINIILSDIENKEMLGFTKAIADGKENQMLKVFITIVDVKNRSGDELAAITRHELGHAFGILHSTAPEDLMNTNYHTNFPYISECDVDAIILLYDNKGINQVICR